MTINEKRYGIIGTIGNGSELINARFRVEPTHSYHVTNNDGDEVAVRYDREFAWDAAVNYIDGPPVRLGARLVVTRKPILKQDAPIRHKEGCILENCPMGCDNQQVWS